LTLVVLLQVPGDGLRAGVESLPGQFLAQRRIWPEVSSLIAEEEIFGRRGPRLERRAFPSAS
jgi:hypothetical protein